jgi:hypothetical protein
MADRIETLLARGAAAASLLLQACEHPQVPSEQLQGADTGGGGAGALGQLPAPDVHVARVDCRPGSGAPPGFGCGRHGASFPCREASPGAATASRRPESGPTHQVRSRAGSRASL